MDQSYKNFKLSSLALALLLMMTACSSSQVEEGEIGAESMAEVSEEATTDQVPEVDPSIDAPEAVASTADEAPALDPDAVDPNAAVADLPPEADPNAVDPGLADPGIATAPAPMDDSSMASNSSLDLPQDETLASDPAPMTETGERDYLATPTLSEESEPEVEQYAVQKKKGKRRSSRVSGDGTTYTVKRGDTLMKIAFENYGDLYRWREIYEANRSQIQDPNNVPPGTQLSLNGAGMVHIERNGEQYLIRHGETLGIISNNVYGTPRKWKKLWENNRELIKDPNKIYAGFYLYYQPEGKLTNSSEPAAVEGEASNVLKEARPVANQQNTAEAPRTPASSQQ